MSHARPARGPVVDERTAEQLLAALMARRAGYVPDWEPSARGADAAMAPIVARMAHGILQRLNQATAKNALAFLDLMGIELSTARSARAPIVFRLAGSVGNSRVPAGTRLAAQAAGGGKQLVFETEQASGLAAARLLEVFSQWAERDAYIDHSADHLAKRPLRLFDKAQLKPIPHAIYLAHDTLLALSGPTSLSVGIELRTAQSTGSGQASAAGLAIQWEYFDGTDWRPFQPTDPACGEQGQAPLDSTAGLSRSGSIRLKSDCAEASKTTIGGVENYWIRGRLAKELLPATPQTLPEVDDITLRADVERLVIASDILVSEYPNPPKVPQLTVKVLDANQSVVTGILVRFSGPEIAAKLERETDGNGEASYEIMDKGTLEIAVQATSDEATHFSVAVKKSDGRLVTVQLRALAPGEPQDVFSDTHRGLLAGVRLDKAFFNSTPIDLSQTFLPFGPSPQAGSTFYFSCKEVFDKPGALMRVAFVRAVTPWDDVLARLDLPHTVAWEYWNGVKWCTLLQTSEAPGDLTVSGFINELPVPPDMTPCDVNGEVARWMRVRLVSGTFGGTMSRHRFPVLTPPSLSDFRLGYVWQFGPLAPQQVITHNDFQFADHTDDAKITGKTFQPFVPCMDPSPALYLGFDGALPADNLGILFDMTEDPADDLGPELLWEYWDGALWQTLAGVDDGTRRLRVPGIARFLAPGDASHPLDRFGNERHWLRVRLKVDGDPGNPLLAAIHPNAVWAAQQETVTNETIGTCNGTPSQAFALRQVPVLPGEVVEVRELFGARANVEWRLVTEEVYSDRGMSLRALEAMLAAEGAERELELPPLRLRRDRDKKVTEVWVRWEGRAHRLDSGPQDRHYLLDRTAGRLRFGDGVNGRVPPVGAAVIARRYVTGGGAAGNVGAKAISQLLGAVVGMEELFNPLPAQGGADGERLDAVLDRGPRSLRCRGRAVLPADYEALAREASPDIAFARALPGREPNGRPHPGAVTLLILPDNADRRPVPSIGLREAVRRYVSAQAPGDLAAAGRIYVSAPRFHEIEVSATVAVIDPSEAGAVEQRVRRALERFLHPIFGGPDGDGWTMGRDVYLSDLAAVIERVEGVDHAGDLALLLSGVPQGERVAVADDRVVVAGMIQLKVVAGEARS
ncbi:MAG: putative baseplate assembly protein [Anaerolineae bacterium]